MRSKNMTVIRCRQYFFREGLERKVFVHLALRRNNGPLVGVEFEVFEELVKIVEGLERTFERLEIVIGE